MPPKWFKKPESEEEDDEVESSEEEEVKSTTKKTTPSSTQQSNAKKPDQQKSFFKRDQQDSEDEDESSEEEDKKPVVKKPTTTSTTKPTPAAAKGAWFKGKGKESESEEEEEESEEEEEEKPVRKPVKPTAPVAKSSKWMKKTEESSEEDEEESDEEEEKPKRAAPKQIPPNLAARAAKWLKKPGKQEESESESEESGLSDEEEEASDDEEEEDKPKQKAKSWFKKTKEEEDEEEEEEEEDKQVVKVKSAKLRLLEKLFSSLDKLEDAKREDKWKEINEELTNLAKIVERYVTTLGQPPNVFIKFLIGLNKASEKAIKDKAELKRKISSDDSGAIVPARSRTKKLYDQYKDAIDRYEKSPELYEDESIEEEEAKLVTKKKATEDEEEEEEEEEEQKTAKGKKGKEKKKPTRRLIEKPAEVSVEPKKVEIQWTDSLIEERVSKIKQSKGKKGTSAEEHHKQLTELILHAKNPALIFELLLLLITTTFDIYSNQECIPIEAWNSCYLNFLRGLEIVQKNPNFKVIEQEEALPVSGQTVISTSSDDEDAHERKSGSSKQKVFGNFISIFERLDAEFIKSLQYMEPRDSRYIQRLRDEALIIDLAERLFHYYQQQHNRSYLARVALRLFRHIYYKRQEDHAKILVKHHEKVQEVLSKSNIQLQTSGPVVIEDTSKLLKDLSMLIYQYATIPSIKVEAMLLFVYHHALHDRFYEARDILLMSRIQDTINDEEVNIQILYNRAVAQLGLCAFRYGMITDAHACLQELCSVNKQRELLAQGFQRSLGEKIDRSKLIPYYMHINLEKIEAVHYICAMLLEIPNMALNNYTAATSVNMVTEKGVQKKKTISKALRHLMKTYEKTLFAGPPENLKDFIYAASKALQVGNWRKCLDSLKSLKIWNLLINSSQLEDMITSRIKTEALRVYLLHYSKNYTNIGASNLANMFLLEQNKVHSIVSKMIIIDELFAAWDQPSQTIFIYRNEEPSKVQQLAVQLSDKLNNIAENNEKLFEVKTGSVFNVGMKDGKQKYQQKSGYGGQGTTNSNKSQRARSQQDGAKQTRTRQQGSKQPQSVNA